MSDPSNSDTDNNAENAQEQAEQRFQIQKIYLKDVSLETPNSPAVFQQQQEWKPRIDVQVHVDSTELGPGVHEVITIFTVTTKHDQHTAYLIELQQAGIFTLLGFPADQLGPMVGAYCPNILFPYARESMDHLLLKAGFPPLQLAPIDFNALYAQRAQAEKEKANATSH